MLSRRERIAMTPEENRRPKSRKLVGRLGVRPDTGFANRSDRLGQARLARRAMSKLRAERKAAEITRRIQLALSA